MTGPSRQRQPVAALWNRVQQAVAVGQDRAALRRARKAAPATGFVTTPEPRITGVANRGLHLLAGNLLSRGEVIQVEGSIWDAAPGDADLAAALHGFGWLDDLAAVDIVGARAQAREWLYDWIDRFGDGAGPEWAPEVTGRRIVRWISHAILLLHRVPPDRSRAYFRSLGMQARYLERRWHIARPGLPRVEALTGLIHAGLAIEGLGHLLRPAIAALGRECAARIAADGGIDSRNPEELTDLFAALSWINQAVSASDTPLDPEILKALERIAPAIRALRLGDGTLARVHGGGPGQPDRIDLALADAGIRTPARAEGAMGYARMSAGGTLVIADMAPPPAGGAYGGTLAFEMSSGRVPLLVNAGPGRRFGPRIARAAQARAAHSGLVLGDDAHPGDADRPHVVTLDRESDADATGVQASHDGFRAGFGLMHQRTLILSQSGDLLEGEDRLACSTDQDRAVFDDRADYDGLRFEVIFHLHPEVGVELDLGGKAASLVTVGGETWILRANAPLTLRDGFCLEPTRLRPRATNLVVVSARAVDYEGAVTWSLTRAGKALQG